MGAESLSKRVSAQFIPKAIGGILLKSLVCAIFLVNIRSWPLMWHVRVFRPLIYLRFRFWWFRLRLLFHGRAEKKRATEEWLEALSPVGMSPFKIVTYFKTRASLDDCDYNMHMSNSCYAKNLDGARFKAFLDFFPTFFRAGGVCPVAGTHFHFLKEIPLLAPYQIRLSIASWENKWFYVLIRYVTLPKGKYVNSKRIVVDDVVPSGDTPPFPNLHTPIDGTATPGPSGISTPLEVSDKDAAMKRLIATHTEPDGAILNCIAISELCFKIGRITIPPSLVVACDGFAGPPPPGTLAADGTPLTAYSRENPPPHWARVRAMLDPNAEDDRKSLRHLREFMTKGWREVPEGERWWEEALGGELEQQRLTNLALVRGVREGMEGAKSVY